MSDNVLYNHVPLTGDGPNVARIVKLINLREIPRELWNAKIKEARYLDWKAQQK